MRALGVDFGRKRIGVAVGESSPRACRPRPSLAASGSLGKDASAIADLAAREETEAVVVGVPENPDDDRQATICRRLADEIRSRGLDVRLVDESLTSLESHAAMADSGLKAAKRRRAVDGESACRILDRFFDSLPD
ncbi:MAG TPA: Holliday junction resolvase RuvX [Fimbriimonadaceae bacterium]|nr:Holliday junction resolvase RuvX [Fimbriimonadaceae bacterium]HRJ95520.1 Holliday junction resolvase RuvX [Fimbriimonadaceae bacterium]